jgi:hypothetical protein
VYLYKKEAQQMSPSKGRNDRAPDRRRFSFRVWAHAPITERSARADHSGRQSRSILFGLGRDRSGNAAAEFALILPVFLTMFAAIIQYGTLFITYNNMLSSARSAAREVAIGKSNNGVANGKAKAKRPQWVSDSAYNVDTRARGASEVESIITVPGEDATILPILPLPDQLSVTVVMDKEG